MTLSYNQILVAVDGSKEAEWAFRKAAGIAKRNDATLNLVHVIDTRSLPANEIYDRAVIERAQEHANELLEMYKRHAEEAGVTKVNLIIDSGSPKKMIPRDLAKRVEADLIVCGATGRNAVERMFLGSVSQHIVRSSACDVLVVRTQEEPDDTYTDLIRKEETT